jgi:stage II sporulation protein D
MFFIGGTMKKILLFSFIFIIIPTIIIFYLVIEPISNNFKFTKNTTVKVYRSTSKVIEEVLLENYVMGVVAGEMPASFNIEALKAQAVAARTYIMFKMLHNKNKKYDVIDTVLNQVYIDDKELKKKWGKNYTKYKNKVKQAVKETAYQYVTYNGEVIDALFFSTSGGYTENSEDIFYTKLDYLKSVKSDWDKISPVFKEQNEYEISDFCKMLHITCKNKPVIKVLSKTKGGKINIIMINNKKFTGKNIVKIFNLRTTNFTINVDSKVIITSHGYGHGVGMSQYGAEGMARVGYKYDEILKYYYTGVEIKKIK